MRTIERYQCEICGSEYDDREVALACEALGLPPPLPFLPWDRAIPCFGESRIEYARLRRVSIGKGFGDWVSVCYLRELAASGEPGHAWLVDTDPPVSVSHNFGDVRCRPAAAFDPRCGWDAFRCFGSAEDLEVWERAMRDYGLDERDAGDYLMDGVRRMRALRALGAPKTTT